MRLLAHLAAALVAVGSAILMTWPLAPNAAHHLLGAAYFWDAYTNTMLMGSHADALLGRAPLSLYDTYYFAPLPRSIVFNENLFGLSLLFFPFYLVSHNPLWAYNLTLLASLALSVFFTYLLVLRLTGSRPAGLVAGVAFAFCPYVLFEIGRIQLVTTQWIPASFLFLHRAFEERRKRDLFGLWLCILLQIGTCLYNAMFLLPLLCLTGVVLALRQRPPRRFWLWFGAYAVGAGVVALAMVYPYFAARHDFNLQRSLSFASSYDGKLDFFANVHETNRTLTGMHHVSQESGAHEEIAFPGFSMTLLALLALLVTVSAAVRRVGAKLVLTTASLWFVLALVTACSSLLTHSMLWGALIFGAGAWGMARRSALQPFGGQIGLYFALLLLAVALFLGLHPATWREAPVQGLYYYLYTYVPGFDGIRKVSRQAVMTTFLVCILAGFGGSWLFSRLRSALLRALACALLLAAVCYELRCFPHPLEPVWAGSEVPEVLRFAASLPAADSIASIPQNEGGEHFSGDAGMALHNYLALYHRHRFVNGQSSWQPPVTELAKRALERLPDEAARRALLAIGTNEIILFGAEIEPERRVQLLAHPDEYRLLFQRGSDSVFRLLQADDPSLALLGPPALPAAAKLIPSAQIHAHAALEPDRAAQALDGDEESFWTSARFQERGQYFEVELSQPEPIVALEIDDPPRVMDAPVSYRISAANGASDLGVIAEQPVLRFYRAQIFSPARFVFRVVFPKPILADRVRITVQQPVPGHYFAVHELRLYAGL